MSEIEAPGWKRGRFLRRLDSAGERSPLRQNLLLDGKSHTLKICDFGTAKRMIFGEQHRSQRELCAVAEDQHRSTITTLLVRRGLLMLKP